MAASQLGIVFLIDYYLMTISLLRVAIFTTKNHPISCTFMSLITLPT